ncbi:MAG: D-alanyl-D-alanine carboxypeptidase [Hyphomicrobium sp.]|nr:D-alanyl-D-alanine carboxypeptidase [Hyphomicrobium sp.]
MAKRVHIVRHPFSRWRTGGLGRVLARIIVALISSTGGLLTGAAALAGGGETGAFTTKAPRAILMDAASGAVLFQRNADDLSPPASMSKLMTLAVLFKEIKDGKISLSDEIVMSENAWRTGGAPSGTSAMMVPINTKARVDELIRGIAIQSGNDAAISIAEHISGSEAAFAKRMTEEARRIGLEKSTFGNATGLPNPRQLMSARELAILARFLITEYPDRYPVFGEREFSYRTHKFFNRNPLLSLDFGVDGLKTGHTQEAGHGLVASAVQDGRRVIAVVSGLATPEDRKTEATKLIKWGFSSISQVKLFDGGEIVGQARVWGGKSFSVPLAGKGDIVMSVPKLPVNQRLTAEIVYKAPLKPPIKQGDQVAVLRVTSTSSASAEIPLYATEDVEGGGIIRKGIGSLVWMALRRLAL